MQGRGRTPAAPRSIYGVSFGSSLVMPSAHQYMQALHPSPAPGGNWSRSDCSSFAPAGRISLPVLSLIGPAKTSNRPNVPGQHLRERVLDERQVGSAGRSATPLRGVWPSMKPMSAIAFESASKYS